VKIVAFSGKRGSGKDAAADVLAREFGFARVALAEPLKTFLTTVLGLPDDDLRVWGPSGMREETIPSVGRSVREMLQTLGTEWGRESVHPDLWIDCLLRRCASYERESLDVLRAGGSVFDDAKRMGRYHDRFVVTDVRFPNEVRRLRERGGVVVRLRRPSAEQSDAASLHASETALDAMPDDAFDRVVMNDGTLDDLAERVRCAVGA